MLSNRPELTYRLGWETQLDYQLEQQGRALLWAARREPNGRIEIRPQSVDRDSLPASVAEISIGEVPSNATIHVALRRWDGESFDAGTFDGKTQSLRIAVPSLRAGKYRVDCFAAVDAKTHAWATAPFEVSSTYGVSAIQTASDSSEPGKAVAGLIRLYGDVPRSGRLEVRLIDTNNRILARQDVRHSGNDVTFRTSIPTSSPMLLRAEAVLMDDAGEVSSAYTYLRVTCRKRDQFNFVMWNCPSGDLAPYGVESMTRYGVTAFLQQGPPPLYVSASNAAWVPYASSFRASSHTITAMLDPDTGLLKSGCVYDRAGMAKAVGDVVEGARVARGHGVLAYSLGDENAVRASCLGPDCLIAYRRYLERIYQTIGALNAEWGTAYASFDDIELLSDGPLPAPDAPDWFKEYFADRLALERSDNEGAKGDALERQIAFGNVNDEMRALQQGNFARWYDRQTFQCATYIEWCKQFQAAFREIDPQALTGFEGTDSFSLRKLTTRSRQGGDLDAFVRELDYYGSYEGPGNEVMRSIAPAGFPMGSWIGYTPDVDELRYRFWNQVADRMNTIQWWRWDNLQGYNGYLAPNLAPFPATLDMFEDTQVVRDGLGELIMRSDMHDDGIAMLYSMPSTHIAHFDGNETYGLYTRDHDRWHTLLHDEGLQFRYVTDRMLRLGEFDASRFKVLILPLAFAMGEREAEVIRDFARNGGIVIADLRPALYDGHCKPLGQGLLNDVFGVSQTGNRAARTIDRMSINGELNEQKLTMRWGNWHGRDVYPQMVVDPNVALTTGNAMGDAAFIHFWTGNLTASMCIVNEFGKGRGILLNFSVHDAPCAGLVRGLLAASGVKPAIRLTSHNGSRTAGVEISRWQNGTEEFAILLSRSAIDLRVERDRPAHVFDVKDQTYLGRTAKFSATLRANRGSVFAFLPGPPVSPRVTVRQSAQRGDTVYARVDMPDTNGARATVVTLLAPGVQKTGWVQSPLILDGKSATVTLPFAYNDPVGTWELRATDLYTGKTSSAAIAVW